MFERALHSIKVEMKAKFVEMKSSYKRLIIYAIIKAIVMRIIASAFEWFDLTNIISVQKITIFPTISEAVAIMKNNRNMAVILARNSLYILYNSESIKTLYILYKLYDWPIVFGLKYAWFSVMKIGIIQALVWFSDLYKFATLLNNPNDINRALTFEQVDDLEFEISNWKMAMNMIREPVNYKIIYEKIKAWLLHLTVTDKMR